MFLAAFGIDDEESIIIIINRSNNNKSVKYADLPASYLFELIAFEMLGPMNLSALNLLNDLGRKISSVYSGDDREGHFLFQRLSVILQRYNAVLLHESFVQSDGLDL